MNKNNLKKSNLKQWCSFLPWDAKLLYFNVYMLSFFRTVNSNFTRIMSYLIVFFFFFISRRMYYLLLLKEVVCLFVVFVFFILKGYELYRTETFANYCNLENQLLSLPL